MAVSSQKQWGLTPAISFALPDEKELSRNESLLAELKLQNSFEKQEETDHRLTVLSRLQHIVEEFVRHVCQKKGLSASTIDNAGGKIFTFGSYRLGVYGPGSDIDTLVVVPKHVSRSDFFEHFPPILETLSPPGTLQELTPVPDAHVPIIKMTYDGIDIDLIFARLQVHSVSKCLDLRDTSLLRGLDETELRSVNGTRVTDEILALVPQTKTFRLALRAIKLWAQRRGCYSNVIGFPGGVAWALMVARICQLYPYACGATIVARFFHLMSEWPWPRPLLLKNIEDGPLQVRIWNPKVYPSDKRHIMPIITPAYPSMCSTHNVSYSTMKVVQRELIHANGITNQIFLGKLMWKDLFKKHTFFTNGYKYYLSVIAASRSKDSHAAWIGLVQSKVRRLITGIEQSDADVEIAHPFNKGFDRVHRCKPDQVDSVLQGNLTYQISETQVAALSDRSTSVSRALPDQSPSNPSGNPGVIGEQDCEEEYVIVYTTTFYIGLELMEGPKSYDISYPVLDFRRQCTEWPQYDENVHSIRVIHTRNYDLPDDVFETGEVKPTRSKKKGRNNRPKSSTPAGSTQPMNKKRSYADTAIEQHDEKSGDTNKRHQQTNGLLAAAG